MKIDAPPNEDFESVTRNLSLRARHVLANLNISDISDLVQITRGDLARARSCGKKTIVEIEKLQAQFRPHTGKYVVSVSENPLNFEKVPKEIFESINRSLNVRARNVIKSLGIDNLSKFMMLDRSSLLSRRNCGRKTAQEILSLQAGLTEFALVLSQEAIDLEPERLLDAPCFTNVKNFGPNTKDLKVSLFDVDNPATWLDSWVTRLSRSPKQAKAFMFRNGMFGSAPMTLEQVGRKVGGCSRERVRQIVKDFEKKASSLSQQRSLIPLINAAADIVDQECMIPLEQLTQSLLCKGEQGRRLRYAKKLIVFFSRLKVWSDAGLLLRDDEIVTKGALWKWIHELGQVVEDVALNTADEIHSNRLWSVDRERLKVSLDEYVARKSESSALQPISDVLLGCVVQQTKGRIKEYEGRIYSSDLWNLKFGPVVDAVEAALFWAGHPVHFGELAQHVSKLRGLTSQRNVHAALDRSDNALLWKRGVFVHRENVVIPFSLIHDVEAWLLELLREEVPFISVYGAFQHFQKRCKQADILTEVALYTCLRLSAHAELLYPRLPQVYLKKLFTEYIPMPVVLENFVRDAGGTVSQQEVKNFLARKVFLKDYQINQLSQRVLNVIRTKDWGYLHLDNTEYGIESIRPIIEYTQSVLTREELCSIDKIYNDKQVSCKFLGIDGPVMLYSLLQCFSEQLFSLEGYPTIARCDGGEGCRHSVRQTVLDFVRDLKKPCPYELLEKRFVKELGYKDQQVYSVLRDAEICLYHTGCVIHYNSLAWNRAYQQQLEYAALQIYEDARKAGLYFGRVSRLVESTGLPELPEHLYWSHTMIADLLTKTGRYIVLGNGREAFVPKKNDLEIRDLESLVALLLRSDWGGAANFREFEQVLVRDGIIRKRLTPSILGNGEGVVIHNKEIILKEFAGDVQGS